MPEQNRIPPAASLPTQATIMHHSLHPSSSLRLANFHPLPYTTRRRRRRGVAEPCGGFFGSFFRGWGVGGQTCRVLWPQPHLFVSHCTHGTQWVLQTFRPDFISTFQYVESDSSVRPYFISPIGSFLISFASQSGSSFGLLWDRSRAMFHVLSLLLSAVCLPLVTP